MFKKSCFQDSESGCQEEEGRFRKKREERRIRIMGDEKKVVRRMSSSSQSHPVSFSHPPLQATRSYYYYSGITIFIPTSSSSSPHRRLRKKRRPVSPAIKDLSRKLGSLHFRSCLRNITTSSASECQITDILCSLLANNNPSTYLFTAFRLSPSQHHSS